MCKFQLSSFKNLGGDSGRSQTLKTLIIVNILCSVQRTVKPIQYMMHLGTRNMYTHF